METTLDRLPTYQRVKRIWYLVGDAQVRKARAMSAALVQHLQRLYEEMPNEHNLLQELVHAHYIAGYTAAMSTRHSDALVPASYFDEMEYFARLLHDDVHMVIARSYRGEMYRRYGDLTQALASMQMAYAAPLSDTAAHGHSAQLLGRVYAQQGDYEQALRLMEEAKQLALHDDAPQNSLHGCYCVGAVYLDYAYYYSKCGYFHKALDFHAQAQAALPDTPYWATFLTAVQGLVLVEGGNIEQGMPIVIQAVKLAQQHGSYCLLDHFYALQRYLGKQALEFNRANLHLGSVLHRDALARDPLCGQFLDQP